MHDEQVAIYCAMDHEAVAGEDGDWDGRVKMELGFAAAPARDAVS